MKDFEYIDSLGCYCHFSGNGFERMVQARREVWFGSDGSGLLRSQFVRSVFFDDEQRARWEASDRGARETSGNRVRICSPPIAGVAHAQSLPLSQNTGPRKPCWGADGPSPCRESNR